ncbi:MAG TPA: rod shape-determining protein, partial [Clostridiales bacterium]|nr:rod shape-determining protein [Clostridiales bacterium]
MLFFERDIAIDMGTSGTLLYVSGKGVQLREPTLVAVDKFTGKLLKIGQEAQRMLGRTPANIL